MRPRFAGGAVDLRPEEIVRLEDDRVVLLDQRRLPDEEVEVECRSAEEVADAIRTMVVRGAPAIGVAAAYGYALAARERGGPRRGGGGAGLGAADRGQPAVGGRADAAGATAISPSGRAISTAARWSAAGAWASTRPGFSARARRR